MMNEIPTDLYHAYFQLIGALSDFQNQDIITIRIKEFCDMIRRYRYKVETDDLLKMIDDSLYRIDIYKVAM